MKREECARLVTVMLMAVPNHRVDPRSVPGMIDAYADLLSDLTYEQCNAAIRVLLQTRTWLPSVADVRATALEIMRGPVRAGGEAWGGVHRAMSTEGAYRQPGVDFVLADPISARCVQALGWQALCLSENPIADRARFIDMYDQLAKQQQREKQAPLLEAAREAREQLGDASSIVLQLAEKLADKPSKEPS